MPKFWIRNDYIHHVLVKISEDKVIFNKNTKMDGTCVDVSGNVGVAPVTVKAGVMVEKSKKVQQEDIIHKSIQESGWTRIDKGVEQTFPYNKMSLHYVSISIHLGNGAFETIAENKEVGEQDERARITKDGALADAHWYHKHLGVGKFNLKSPSKEYMELLKQAEEFNSEIVFDEREKFKFSVNLLIQRLTENDPAMLSLAKTRFVGATHRLISSQFDERNPNWKVLEVALEEAISDLKTNDHSKSITKMQNLHILFEKYEANTKLRDMEFKGAMDLGERSKTFDEIKKRREEMENIARSMNLDSILEST